MAIEVLLCGSDIPVDFELNQSNGSDLNLTGVAQILVAFYFQERSGQVVARFAKTAASGYTLLEVTNAAQGKFRCMIPAANTEALDGGILLCDVKVKITDNSLTDGDFETIMRAEKIAELKPSPLSRA